MVVPKLGGICKITSKVWEELLSWKFANSFYLAKSIAEKFAKCKGDNIFLEGAKGGLASGPGKNFKDTDEGNKIIEVCFVEFDGYLNDNDNIILPRDGKNIPEI